MDTLKILIPTDFSVQAEYAYLLVKNIENKMDVEVHFIHIMDVPDTVTLDVQGTIHTCGEIDVNYIKHQKEIIDRKLTTLKEQYGEKINTHLLFGKTTTSIVEFAETHKFDLIVMGTKGAWGLKEKLSGSETQMIARNSKIPLLSLMCDRTDLVIDNVLLVHDYRDAAKEDLSLLNKLTKAFNSKVHQLQIVSRADENMRVELLKLMDEHAQENSIKNYENHLINDNDIENGVIHFNQMYEMDIVFIGTHGKGGLLHKSATEKLINHLFKPIISFHIN